MLPGSTADSRPASLPKPLDSLGPYKLLQQIGEGGMGTVWMAEQMEPIRRIVALKIIKPGMDSGQVLARFDAERHALALMDHANIAKVLDAGTTPDGRPYFVMEMVKGIPLTTFCDEQRFKVRERIPLFIAVCEAIQHAHLKGIIHRDIKPSNVLVAVYDGKPVPKVIDFGIAKATISPLTEQTLFTECGVLLGTPEYMSPEQAELSQLDIDTRSDVYSLGVLLYELLTGSTPMTREALRQTPLDQVLRRIREEDPDRPSARLTHNAKELSNAAGFRGVDEVQLVKAVKGDLDWIALKALEKDRNRRYESCSALASDLHRYLNDEEVEASPPGGAYRFRKLVQRNKSVFLAGAVAGIAILTALGVSLWQVVQKTQAYNRAREAEVGQRQERQKAQDAHTQAQMEARRAIGAEQETKGALAAADFSQSIRLLADGMGSSALAYLVRSLRLNPTNAAAVTRLTTAMTHRSWPLPILGLRLSNDVAVVRFTPDGRQIAIADGRMVRIWDILAGKPLTVAFEHSGNVLALDVDSKGKRLVAASEDGNVRVWDIMDGRLIPNGVKHMAGVGAVRFSPDGRRIVTGSRDYTAQVWDSESGFPVGGVMRHSNEVATVAWSPLGDRVATGCGDAIARIWDSSSGRQLLETESHGRGIEFVQFSPDGSKLFTIEWDGPIRYWDAQTGTLVRKEFKQDRSIRASRLSPDGNFIASVAWDSVRISDADEMLVATEGIKFGDRVIALEFNGNNSRIATACDNRQVEVWDILGSQALAEPIRHSKGTTLAQLSPDGMRLLTTGAGDKALKIWDSRSGGEIASPIMHDAEVLAAQFSPDGKWIATGSANKSARVWNAHSGQALTPPLNHSEVVTGVRFSPDCAHLLTTSKDGRLRVWDAHTGRMEFDVQVGKDADANWSSDGRRIVSFAPEEEGRIWTVGNPKPIVVGQGLRSVEFSPDGTRVVGNYYFNTYISDAVTGTDLVGPLKHPLWISAPHFSPDGKRILTASWHHGARIWDAQDGRALVGPFSYSEEGPISATFGPDGSRVFTCSGYAMVRLWDSLTGFPLSDVFRQSGDVSWPVAASTDRRILCGPVDGAVRMWDIGPSPRAFPEWLLDLTEAVSGQVVNEQSSLMPTKLDRARTIQRIRETLDSRSEPDDWTLWGRWFLGDRSGRMISPFSKIAIPEYIDRRVHEGNTEALTETQRSLIGGPTASAKIAIFRRNQRGQAEVLRKEGRLEEAAKMLEEAMAEQNAAFGTNHAYTLASSVALAGLQEQAGYLTNAAKLRETILALRRSTLGNEAPATLSTMQLLARNYDDLNWQSEAETLYRELVSTLQVGSASQSFGAQCITDLADLLDRQDRLDEVEQLLGKFLESGKPVRSQLRDLLIWRADFRARHRQWRGAAIDFAEIVRLSPNDVASWYGLALLQVQLRDLESFRLTRKTMTERFRATPVAYIAQRISKAIMLIPCDDESLAIAIRLADTALLKGTNQPIASTFVAGSQPIDDGRIAPPNPTDGAVSPLGEPSSGNSKPKARSTIASSRRSFPLDLRVTENIPILTLFVKSLAQHREGDHASVLTSMDQIKIQLLRQPQPQLEAQSAFLKSMALQGLKRSSEARDAFKLGAELTQKQALQQRKLLIRESWMQGVFTEILMREAGDNIGGNAP